MFTQALLTNAPRILSLFSTKMNAFSLLIFIGCWSTLVTCDLSPPVPSNNLRPVRAVSISLQNLVGFNPRDILFESLESKTCFDLKNRGQSPGTEVILNTCGFPNPQSSQLYTLQDLDGQHFLISTKNHRCMGFATANSNLASLEQCNTDSAKFFLDFSADGQSFLIRQKTTGRCITPSGSGGTSGSGESLRAVLCNNNDPRQYWRIFSKDKPRRYAPHPSRCMS